MPSQPGSLQSSLEAGQSCVLNVKPLMLVRVTKPLLVRITSNIVEACSPKGMLLDTRWNLAWIRIRCNYRQFLDNTSLYLAQKMQAKDKPSWHFRWKPDGLVRAISLCKQVSQLAQREAGLQHQKPSSCTVWSRATLSKAKFLFRHQTCTAQSRATLSGAKFFFRHPTCTMWSRAKPSRA